MGKERLRGREMNWSIFTTFPLSLVKLKSPQTFVEGQKTCLFSPML